MAREFEIKYAVGDLQKLDCLLCDALVREKMTQPQYRYVRMETTYYDTEDGAFAARKWTLRLRKENERSVISLKTSGEGYARGEWEWEGEYLEEAAEPLIALGAPEALRTLLEPSKLTAVCSAKFTRILAELSLGATRCELAGDVGWLLGGGRQEPLCELELELKAGEEDAMLTYAHTIAEKYALSEETRSKFARARALADTQ